MVRKSQDKPLITVVIPAFNEEKYLPSCLEALKNQTYPKNTYEVVVIDNNSTDNTAQIAQKFGVRVIKERKQGYVFTLKKGMDQASGDIIAVTDADSQVLSDWLEKIAAVFADSSVVGLTGGSILDSFSKTSNTLSKTFYHLFLKSTFFIGKPNTSGSNIAVRKSAYHKIGGIDTGYRMSPDVDLGMRLKAVGRVVYVPNLVVITSTRRFKDNLALALWEYGKGYLYATWLRKPPTVTQKVIR